MYEIRRPPGQNFLCSLSPSWNVRGNDSGTYNCSAVNILGQAQALVRLIVNGKTFMK